MNIRVLAVGDVVGEAGLDFLCRRLPALRQIGRASCRDRV